MGMYDTFGEEAEQLKVGECVLHHYTIGEKVDLPNGIYCGYSRAIVINGGLFVADMPLSEIYDKWGQVIELKEIINEANPISKAMKKIEKGHDDASTHKWDDESSS